MPYLLILKDKIGSAKLKISHFIFIVLVAHLLDLDDKKFAWALCNYCLVVKGTAARRKHTVEEAKEALEVFARGLYWRLVDWMVNNINLKLSFSRAVL